MKTFNETNVRELELYANNTGELYNQKQSIIKNLTKKVEKGTYDPALAPKLWRYWVDAAAKMYAKEFGNGEPIFSIADRNEVARQLADDNYQLIKDALAEVA